MSVRPADDASVLLATAPLAIEGRIMPASNHTYLARLGENGPQCVYKPRTGERPLWDFADGTLAMREYAAWLVSDHLGWDVVPPTLLREGPAGFGMVQLWCEPDPDQEPVDVVPAGALPPGYLHVLDATGPRDEPVALVHEDTPALRRVAVFDLIVNNTDRKGGHVLPMPDGHRYGVDHGVCFHTDDKLRTVLWGWSGQRLEDAELEGVERVRDAVCASAHPLRQALEGQLATDEIEALVRRCERILARRRFPDLGGGWPSIPWPPF